MTYVFPNPFEFDISETGAPLAAPCCASVTTAGAVVPPSASAVSNSESAAPIPARESAPTTTAGADLQIPAPAAFSEPEKQSDLEFFLEYAQRRSMRIVSPALPKAEREIALDFQLLFKIIKEPDDVGDFDDPPVYPLPACVNHPRDLDLDSVFLNSPAFQPEETRGIVGSLLKLAGVS